MTKFPPLWVLLGLTRATGTITVIGFRMGDEAGARRLLAERSKDQHYDDAEVFNFSLPAEKVRYQAELWLVGAGLSREEAAKEVRAIAKLMGEELRQLRKRKK